MSRFLSGFLVALATAVLVGCQAPTSAENPDPEPAKKPDAVAETRTKARDEQLKKHHDKCVDTFVEVENNGLSRMIVFQHRNPKFSNAVELPPDAPELDGNGQPLPAKPVNWVMEKIELVSLLNHDTPGVYSASNVRFIGRKNPKIRDLDGFETPALEKIQGGADVQVHEMGNQIRVLGAIRMRQECVSCHKDKPVGSVVGAFSYLFRKGV